MKAILTQTIGPHHKAGDVVRSSNTKIKRLIDKGVATEDHSIIGMVGSILVWIIAAMVMFVSVISLFGNAGEIFPFATEMSPLWIWTLIVFPFIATIVSLTQYYNAKNPYIAYFLGISISFVGGLLIMVGHERACNKYQDKRMSGLAALFLVPLGVITFLIMTFTSVTWQSGGPDAGFLTTSHFITWTIYMCLLMIGIAVAIFFDSDFLQRRKRFIEFLQRKNSAVEYKDKALKALRVFRETHNQESFNDRIIDIFEHTLEQDMRDVLTVTGQIPKEED